jgi:hypothetical protein
MTEKTKEEEQDTAWDRHEAAKNFLIQRIWNR